jgi:MFS family permease
VGVLLVALALLAVGFGGTLPSVVSLLSLRAPEDVQGGILGLGQSVGSSARILGPVLAGWAFDHLGVGWPYIGGAAVAFLALAASFTLRQPGSVAGKAGAAPTLVARP